MKGRGTVFIKTDVSSFFVAPQKNKTVLNLVPVTLPVKSDIVIKPYPTVSLLG